MLIRREFLTASKLGGQKAGRPRLSLLSFTKQNHIFSYTIEIISPKWRAFAGQMNHIYYAIGCILSSPLSYLYRDWQTFSYSVTGEYQCSTLCSTEGSTCKALLSYSLATFAFLVFHSRISQMVIFEKAFDRSRGRSRKIGWKIRI